MAIDFIGGVQQLESWGLYDVMLPFLLVFVLVFAILEKIQLFGRESKKFNAIIALVIGMLLVRGGEQSYLVEFINRYLPNVSAVIVVFLGFMIILGLFGVGAGAFRGGLMIFFIIISLIGGIWALTKATEDSNVQLPFGIELTEQDAGASVVIAIFLIIISVAFMKPKKGGMEGFVERMGKMGDSFAGIH
ncbi:hypothetical protein FJZ53_07130 [Candidatus Woesearchaeota archaeon]|nr:hypothetical protein [Candidatus Woesearchaeota archaeon]